MVRTKPLKVASVVPQVECASSNHSAQSAIIANHVGVVRFLNVVLTASPTDHVESTMHAHAACPSQSVQLLQMLPIIVHMTEC